MIMHKYNYFNLKLYLKNLIAYFVSLLSTVILAKLENLFSICQGQGRSYSNPEICQS